MEDQEEQTPQEIPQDILDLMGKEPMDVNASKPEIGFYHPSIGYWQAIAGVTPDILEKYPEGTIQVPLIPGSNYEWKDNEWVEKPVEPIVYTDEEIKLFRAAAYIREADPIFFKYQRGEATENDWTTKVQEIRDRYPYNTPPQQQEEE